MIQRPARPRLDRRVLPAGPFQAGRVVVPERLVLLEKGFRVCRRAVGRAREKHLLRNRRIAVHEPKVGLIENGNPVMRGRILGKPLGDHRHDSNLDQALQAGIVVQRRDVLAVGLRGRAAHVEQLDILPLLTRLQEKNVVQNAVADEPVPWAHGLQDLRGKPVEDSRRATVGAPRIERPAEEYDCEKDGHVDRRSQRLQGRGAVRLETAPLPEKDVPVAGQVAGPHGDEDIRHDQQGPHPEQGPRGEAHVVDDEDGQGREQRVEEVRARHGAARHRPLGRHHHDDPREDAQQEDKEPAHLREAVPDREILVPQNVKQNLVQAAEFAPLERGRPAVLDGAEDVRQKPGHGQENADEDRLDHFPRFPDSAPDRIEDGQRIHRAQHDERRELRRPQPVEERERPEPGKALGLQETDQDPRDEEQQEHIERGRVCARGNDPERHTEGEDQCRDERRDRLHRRRREPGFHFLGGPVVRHSDHDLVQEVDRERAEDRAQEIEEEDGVGTRENRNALRKPTPQKMGQRRKRIEARVLDNEARRLAHDRIPRQREKIDNECEDEKDRTESGFAPRQPSIHLCHGA